MSDTSPGFFASLIQFLLAGAIGFIYVPFFWYFAMRGLAQLCLKAYPLAEEAGFLLRFAHWLFQ